MPPLPPDPEVVALAYELHLETGKVARVKEELGKRGHPVSLSTVYEWIKQGQAAAAHIEILEREEERQRANQRLNVYVGILFDAYRTRGSDPVACVRELVRIEERRAAMLGLDAPKRVSVSEEKTPPAVDPNTVAAVRAARNRVAEEERTLLGEALPELPGPGNI